MKNNPQYNSFAYLFVSAALLILLLLIANPFGLWMPDMMHLAVLALMVVVFGVFAAFVLRETDEDERAVSHRALAGRVAFLAGSAVLAVGILVQGWTGMIDVWLISTLVVMVLAKVGTRLYSDRKL